MKANKLFQKFDDPVLNSLAVNPTRPVIAA